MSDATHQEDETLIAQLRSALDQVDPVPADVTDFAKAALDWQNIDAVLASQ